VAKQIQFDIVARDKASKTFSKIGGAAKLLGVVGLGSIVTNAVQTEAQFSKTMNLMQAGSNASGKEMDKLRALAVKMGADTQFSAGQAAEAMLELNKAGITPAAIQAGALEGTLTLAAAGGLDMANAATIAGNALNTFGLKAKDMNSVAAALAGGANASTASVESMGMALAQVGPGAKTAGLSIQETTAVLAAFDNAGIKGSDAGTSLKTMLTRLVPSTRKASNAMKDLGLKFTDSHGQFKSISNISEQLRTKMGKLSDAERTHYMNTIFGSDATRAATVLMGEGAKGVNKMIRATKDQNAAQRMAKASMKGTAGALERMGGSLETASLAIGQLLAPAVVFLADHVGALANEFVAFMPKIQAAVGFVQDHNVAFTALAVTIGTVVALTKIHTAVMAVQAAGGMMAMLKATKLVTTVTKAYAAVQWVLNAALAANPIVLVVVAIAALVAALVIAYKKSATFRRIVDAAFRAVKNAAMTALGWIKKNWHIILAILTGPIGLAVLAIAKNWDKIKDGARAVVDFVKSIPDKLGNLAGKFGNAGKDLIRAFVDGMKNAAGIIAGIAGNVWNTVKGLLNAAIDKINSALEFKISLPGPDISVNLPDIPHLAKGGIVRRPTLALIGEAGPEAVVPLSGAGAGGGGMSVVINVNGARDPKMTAREIHKELLRLKSQLGRGLELA